MNARGLLIGDIFRAGARAVPHRVAAAIGDQSISFADLDASANAHAAAFAALGVGHRDRVVLWSNNSLEAVPVFVALAKMGAVFAPANALLSVDEATEMAGLARPSALVVDAAHESAGGVVVERLSVPLAVLGSITNERSDALDAGLDPVVPDPVVPDPVVPDPVVPDLRETDPHVVFFTSGTTGRSKGVVLSHRVNYLRSHPGSQFEPHGPTVCMYPMFHMGAWTMALHAWQNQASCVFVEQADPELLCDAIGRWDATHFNAIPAVWRRIFEYIVENPDARSKLASLHIADSGTSATPPELLASIRDLLPHATRRVFYGSTEAGAVALLQDGDMERKPGSCGVPQHSCRTRLDAETGELQVQGPLLFDGYFEDTKATDEVMTADGWFRTGDVAEEDDEGFYSIVGRVKDVIRTGGETVAPTEVELALAGHPAIVDVAVVGLPDPEWGEVVCAAVVVATGATPPDVGELRAYVADRLARFKQPRRVVVIAEVPRTPATRQVQRRLLIERITSGSNPES